MCSVGLELIREARGAGEDAGRELAQAVEDGTRETNEGEGEGEGEGGQAKPKVRRARSKVGVEDGARLGADIKVGEVKVVSTADEYSQAPSSAAK
jgi:hypothetical protein